jgi:tRNA(Ile)-lysidine synthase
MSQAFDKPALDRLFAPLQHAPRIIAAVSGGPDSIALMHLLSRWNEGPLPQKIIIATVDHGLRPEAAEEARWVSEEAAALGFSHRILVWAGEKPATGLQERARDARYHLLVNLAHETGASHLVTAHTLDDQAETVLMRMARGSGLSGLAGMAAERDRDGIRHLRPLLECPKVALVDLCEREGWRFATDPSNRDERFARVRWRRLMPALAAEGLSARRLTEFARRVRQADEALDVQAAHAFGRARLMDAGDEVVLDAAAIAAEPFEIALRLVMKGLTEAGLPEDRRRLQRLESCVARIREAVRRRQSLRMTIAGALVDLDRSGRLRITAETPRQRGR